MATAAAVGGPEAAGSTEDREIIGGRVAYAGGRTLMFAALELGIVLRDNMITRLSHRRTRLVPLGGATVG